MGKGNCCEEETEVDKSVNVVSAEIKREYLKANTWNCMEYRVTYSNGDVYEGETDANASTKDGWGAYFYSNGDKYEGFFENDLIHGYGRYW